MPQKETPDDKVGHVYQKAQEAKPPSLDTAKTANPPISTTPVTQSPNAASISWEEYASELPTFGNVARDLKSFTTVINSHFYS